MTTFQQLTVSERSELWATLAIRSAEGLGPRKARKLVESYGTVLAAVEAGLARPAEWTERGLVPLRAARAFAAEAWRQRAKEEWLALGKVRCGILLWSDERYPSALKNIIDPPLLLCWRGNLSLLRGPAVGVVGARNCTREGLAVSAFFSRELAGAGVAVISGMAKGIDRAAHLAGLEGPGGSIAVLGTGIDVVYPLCNADLYHLLAEKGLLLSEFAPGTAPNSKHFPIRNRLISGLSQGILVVEAASRSGSLITARLALEQNRDVFAVPGHTMASVSEGCRALIRQGAKAAFSADDVLRELAPLLALEAQKALEARRRASEGAQAPAARDPRKDAHEAALAEAVSVLPEGGLPWIAPPLPLGRAKAVDAAPSSNPRQKRRTRAGQETVPAKTALKRAGEPDKAPVLDEDERRVMASLSEQARHIDVLARGSGLDVARLSGLLAMLEVRGLVCRRPGMLYSLPGA